MPFDMYDAVLKHRTGAASASYVGGTGRLLARLPYNSVGKRVMDIILVLLSLIVVVPVVSVLALLVSLDGHAPFYTQLRVGRGGKLFRIIKLRTMVHNADALLNARLDKDPILKAEWASTQKLKQDFRITRIGRFLRKTSLDELPQLINVLTGSMSLVGPRPMMPSQRRLYSGQSYYRLRPGITGFWQISDRNNCNFGDRAIYDADYERAVSLSTDIKVILRTIVVVWRGTGC